MKSPFRDRSVFWESLNIYPIKIFSLKLEGFYEVLGALAILGFMERWVKRLSRFHVEQ